MDDMYIYINITIEKKTPGDAWFDLGKCVSDSAPAEHDLSRSELRS